MERPSCVIQLASGGHKGPEKKEAGGTESQMGMWAAGWCRPWFEEWWAVSSWWFSPRASRRNTVPFWTSDPQNCNITKSRCFKPMLIRLPCGQSCLTVCNPMDYSLAGFSILGILQARMLEWVAISSSRGSSQLRDRTHVFYISFLAGEIFMTSATCEDTCMPVADSFRYMAEPIQYCKV